MFISSTNRNTLIRENIIQTLKDITTNTSMNVVSVPHGMTWTPGGFYDLNDVEFANLSDSDYYNMPDYGTATIVCTVYFYSDAERSNLIFSENSTDFPTHFRFNSSNTYYLPPYTKLAQITSSSSSGGPTVDNYYVTVTFSDSSQYNLVYKNYRNQMFQSVIVASKKNPQFSTNDNSAVIVPIGEETINPKWSDDIRFTVLKYDIYIQRLIFKWKDLSEAERLADAENVYDCIRNALYQDRNRGRQACFVNNDLDGTNVGNIDLLPSKDALKAKISVKCGYMVTSHTN